MSDDYELPDDDPEARSQTHKADSFFGRCVIQAP
jgi:hypothetical protein